MLAIALYVVAALCLVGGIYARGLLVPELVTKSGFPLGSPIDSLMFEANLAAFKAQYLVANGVALAGLLVAILFATLGHITHQLARLRAKP